jgi:hypothetical protein
VGVAIDQARDQAATAQILHVDLESRGQGRAVLADPYDLPTADQDRPSTEVFGTVEVGVLEEFKWKGTRRHGPAT